MSNPKQRSTGTGSPGKNITKRKKRPSPPLKIVVALRNGDGLTRLSLLILGLGSLVRGQIGRFAAFFAVQACYVIYMATAGVKSLAQIVHLGTVEQGEVYNDKLGIFEYSLGDNSMLILLYGVITIMITFGYICFMLGSARCAYAAQTAARDGRRQPKFREDVASLFDANLHKLLLTWPILGVLFFTIIPIIFMILIAFTNYDRNHQPPGNLFDWVGMTNFSAMLSTGGEFASTFWPVLQWTIIWAICATSSCYILGMLLAIVINRKGTRIKSFWRFCFVLSIAMPAFVSLLTMRTVFANNGAYNILLRSIGMLAHTETFSYFGDAITAKLMVILINIWIGVPFTMLTTTGILQNIPAELYEAANVDGASPVRTFISITLPYMLFVTTPYLITTFVGNINNFNVIFLLTGGGPDTLDYHVAGRTDLLVTWLYKLTIVNKDYNLGSVIGIAVFVLMATFSLIAYRQSGAYKNEEEFQK